MRSLAAIALVLAGFSLASADEIPPASPPEAEPAAPAPAPVPEPALAPPAMTPAAPTSKPLEVEIKASKRPGAVLNIPRPTQGQYAEKPNVSRTPAIIATATSGVLLALTAAAYWRFDSLANSAALDHNTPMFDPNQFARDQKRIERTHRWMKISPI